MFPQKFLSKQLKNGLSIKNVSNTKFDKTFCSTENLKASIENDFVGA